MLIDMRAADATLRHCAPDGAAMSVDDADITLLR